MRQVLRILFLTSIWVLLWGRVSLANVASGVMVSALLLVLYPTGEPARTPVGRPRPLAVARLLGFVLRQMVVSNAYIAREIVTRGSNIRTGIVACRLRTDSERTITFLANVLSLSPGTMPVHVQVEPPVIYVHVLHLDHPDTTRAMVSHLEELAVQAFGSPQSIAAMSSRPHTDQTVTDPVVPTAPSDGGAGLR